MRRAIMGLAALLIAIAPARAQDAIPANAQNCNLASPPDGSGVVVAGMRGKVFDVFPRKTDMPRDYTGCQVVWSIAFDPSGTQVLAFRRTVVFYFERGLLVLAHTEPQEQTCRYRDGTSVLHPADCPAHDETHPDVPLSSAPAACLDDIATHQPDSKRCNETD